jgi:hypothetical protein
MPRRKKTLRRMSPLARELAKLQDELKSLARRMDRLIQWATQDELDAIAFRALNAEESQDAVLHPHYGVPLCDEPLDIHGCVRARDHTGPHACDEECELDHPLEIDLPLCKMAHYYGCGCTMEPVL